MRNRLSSFKAYDIRGVVPNEITPNLAYRIARAMALWSQADEVIVGRDARLSSPSLAESLMNGFLDGGVSVIDLGMLTTPMLNFSVARFKRFGLMITASHNPKEYNGFKIIDPNVEQVYYGRGLEQLEQLVLKDRYPKIKKRGRILVRSIKEEYQNYLVERFNGISLSSRRVVVDCSNGVGGIPLQVLEKLGIPHSLLFHTPDGDFPNHACDTLQPGNLKKLQNEVKKQKADLGIMFDGDSDRVTFVDECGNIAPIDLVFILLARQELKMRKGRVFYDLRFSKVVMEEIEKSGGQPVMLRVGNPFHKEALHRHQDGLLAAELSGHIMYKEHFGIDDPLYASLKLLASLPHLKGSFSRQLKPFKRYVQSGEIRIESKNPGKLVEKIKSGYQKASISELDGVTVTFPKWWFNLRTSNTESVAKLVIEDESEKSLQRHKKELIKFLKN